MPSSLPLRASLEWLKKLAKERLADLRVHDPQAQLSGAQLAVAREYGFSSWRKLKSHVEQLRDKLAAVVPPQPEGPAENVAADDPELIEFVAAVNAGDIPKITGMLSRRPALARAHGRDGQTPLHAAAWCNDNRLAVLLLAYGADPHAKYGHWGHTPLSWAVTCNSLAFAQTLVRLGNPPDLFCAAGMGAIDEVRACFDGLGALLPGASRTGSSRIAADGSRLACPPSKPVEQISDALYLACRNAHVEVVRFLLAKAPELSFRAYMGGTPLHWAYFGGSREVIDLLLAAGADASARDDVLRCTPRGFGICVPANWGMTGKVRQRLAEDPTLANFMDGGTSPLHEAARGGNGEVVQILLDGGADSLLRNGAGQMPMEVAAEGGHAAVADLLQQRVRS